MAGLFSGLVEECRLAALRTVTGDLVDRITYNGTVRVRIRSRTISEITEIDVKVS